MRREVEYAVETVIIKILLIIKIMVLTKENPPLGVGCAYVQVLPWLCHESKTE